ncbi:MAG: D-inositol 3-phosphate glycosyltransferase [bacterium ADurb.Bin400]|nr:MAG: D-inositol 3-phosphate glycosyltransferase [bacterium ADurb.Bin400]
MTMKPHKIWFISSYVPRMCGIATFTDNLMDAIKAADQRSEFLVCAMDDDGGYDYPDAVKCVIRQEESGDYSKAAELINASDADVVCIQHEFGIFGGFNGRKLLDLLQSLNKPVVLTLHTVPIHQTEPFVIVPKRFRSRKKLLQQIFRQVRIITVMTETAREYLIHHYQVSPDQVVVIPHGAPVLTEVGKSGYRRAKEAIGFEKNDFVISSFGLISPKKGLEYVIRALPAIIKQNPEVSVKYLIAGRMHPKKSDEYLTGLKQLAKDRGVADRVVFDNRYLTFEEIYRYLANTDIYITPYYAKEQVSSGTLSYALAAGCCVVSTPYIFASELVKRFGIGELIEFRDEQSIKRVVGRLVAQPELVKQYRQNAEKFGSNIHWPQIGQRFLDVFDQLAR